MNFRPITSTWHRAQAPGDHLSVPNSLPGLREDRESVTEIGGFKETGGLVSDTGYLGSCLLGAI